MSKQTIAISCAAILILGIAQTGYAAGIDTRIERRHDAVENTADRLEDKQEFREERRDCVGEHLQPAGWEQRVAQVGVRAEHAGLLRRAEHGHVASPPCCATSRLSTRAWA